MAGGYTLAFSAFFGLKNKEVFLSIARFQFKTGMEAHFLSNAIQNLTRAIGRVLPTKLSPSSAVIICQWEPFYSRRAGGLCLFSIKSILLAFVRCADFLEARPPSPSGLFNGQP